MTDTAKRLLNQLRNWRQRWRPQETEEGTEKLIDKMFANTFHHADGKGVLDYLIETYYQPVEFVGPGDTIRLAERNGQQKLVVDMLVRFDRGMHPAAFEKPEDREQEKPWDGRQ